MDNMMDITETIREFMANELSEQGFTDSITNDESLIDSYILDSLSILMLITFLDEKFGIIPNDDEINPEQFETINKIKAFIQSKIDA